MANNTTQTIPDSLNNLDQSKLFNDIKKSGKLELKQPVNIKVCTADEGFGKCVNKNKIKLNELKNRKVVSDIVNDLITTYKTDYKKANLRLCVTDDFKTCKERGSKKGNTTEPFVNYGSNKMNLKLLLKSILFSCLFIILNHKTTYNNIIKVYRPAKSNYIYITTLLFFILYFIINVIV